jgi:serine/threonine-protein kinase HipA
MLATIQIFIDGKWTIAGTFDSRGGISTGGYLEYDPDFVLAHLENRPECRMGLRYPTNFELHQESRWPAFLLDILPTGAGRRVWARRLGLVDSEEADWQLLLHGAGNPPGNLRVAESVIPPAEPHPGFTKEEVVEKNADFIEYAETRGAVVAGATDVAGDAPKFLLARDRKRRWHPDGALEDQLILDSWLVKFPRGKTEADRMVLRNEAPYYEVARCFGVRTGGPLEFIDDTLFIPRFDREIDNGKCTRHGLETLSSAAGIAEYGRRGDHAHFCSAITTFASDSRRELLEYLLREILNCALRNTDNHGRKSALIKYADGRVMLSPLYDFAPMFLDPEGIARSSRWAGDMEPTIGRPAWGKIVKLLHPRLDQEEARAFLAEQIPKTENLPETMRECGVEEKVIQLVARRCDEIAADLRDAVQGS